MWIIEYYSNHLQTDVKMYYANKEHALYAYRQKCFDHKNVTMKYDSNFELQKWERQHG